MKKKFINYQKSTVMNAKQLILNDFNLTFNQNLKSFKDIENFLDSEQADGISEAEIDNFDSRNSINYKNI